MYTTLKLEIEAGLALLTLDRPEKRNALSAAMIEEMLAALDEIETAGARAAIIAASGRAFCAGMDLEMLKSLADRTPEQNLEDSRQMARLFLRLYRFPVPLVAAVNGPALAGGCGVATLCDFTLASPEARFGYTEVRIGFIPALVSVFLVRQVGEKRARDLLLTGRILGPEEAREIGLINEIVPAHELMVRARELSAALARSSPTSLRRTKRLLVRMAEDGIDREIAMAAGENAEIRSTADFREGLAAFLEKREPKWREE